MGASKHVLLGLCPNESAPLLRPQQMHFSRQEIVDEMSGESATSIIELSKGFHEKTNLM